MIQSKGENQVTKDPWFKSLSDKQNIESHNTDNKNELFLSFTKENNFFWMHTENGTYQYKPCK